MVCSKKISQEDEKMCKLIAYRAAQLWLVSGRDDVIDFMIVMENCHKSTPLNLKGLLKACDFDFIYDIKGILGNFDKKTRSLKNGFIPRFALSRNGSQKDNGVESIYKYKIDTVPEQSIKMPAGAEILCVQMRKGAITLWAKASAGSEVEDRKIHTIKTDWSISDEKRKYIGTVQDDWGDVWHVFEGLGGLLR